MERFLYSKGWSSCQERLKGARQSGQQEISFLSAMLSRDVSLSDLRRGLLQEELSESLNSAHPLPPSLLPLPAPHPPPPSPPLHFPLPSRFRKMRKEEDITRSFETLDVILSTLEKNSLRLMEKRARHVFCCCFLNYKIYTSTSQQPHTVTSAQD